MYIANEEGARRAKTSRDSTRRTNAAGPVSPCLLQRRNKSSKAGTSPPPEVRKLNTKWLPIRQPGYAASRWRKAKLLPATSAAVMLRAGDVQCKTCVPSGAAMKKAIMRTAISTSVNALRVRLPITTVSNEIPRLCSSAVTIPPMQTGSATRTFRTSTVKASKSYTLRSRIAPKVMFAHIAQPARAAHA
eukprot:scaffold185001_cov32-Tisochrysis_lutea.AAC.3